MQELIDKNCAIRQQPPRDAIYFEAMRYCERYGIGSDGFRAVEASFRIRAFQEAMEPFVREITRLTAMQLLPVILSDGTIAESPSGRLDPALEAQFRDVEKAIAKQCGVPTDALRTAP